MRPGKLTLLSLAMFLWVPMFAQTQGPDNPVRATSEKNNAPYADLIAKLENVRIVFKDGSIRKNCKVTEIKDYWIVYEKGGSLHDAVIDRIERIEIGLEGVVTFNKMKKPVLR